MNTPEDYDQQHHVSAAAPRAALARPVSTPSELAEFGDRSLHEPTAPATPSTGANPRVTRWVRPTETPEVGMRALGWAIDQGFAAQSRVIHAVTRSTMTRLRRRPELPAGPDRPATTSMSDGLGLS